MAVLIPDDWGPEKLTTRQSSNYGKQIRARQHAGDRPADGAGMVQMVSNPTVADALIDRLVHNSHHSELRGESPR